MKKIPKKPKAAKAAPVKKPAVSKAANHQYLYERFVQLYIHSSHARHSFAWLVLFKKSRVPAPIAVIPEGSGEDESAASSHWLHLPYPYSGFTRLLAVFAAVAGVSVIVQVMYPSGRALPLSHLEGNGFVGLRTQAEIAQKIKIINNSPVTVTTRSSSLDTSYSAMGVKANADDTFKALSDYPLERRFIPFSIFFQSLSPTKVSRDVNVEKLTNFTKSILTVPSKESVSARVTMQGSRLVITPAEEGYNYEQASLQKQIAQASLGRAPIVLEPEIIAPKLSTRAAQASVTDMQKRIDAGITISAAEQNIHMGPETVASWVVVEEKPDVGTISLYFDRQKVAESLRPVIATVDTVGVPEEITLLNGNEAGRKPGKPGRALQFEDLVNQVSSATDWTIGLIQANVAREAPKQNYHRSYSRDSYGFQSLVDYWASTNKGRFGVALQTQNGRITASTNGHQAFSGTHKLYLPHLTYGRITARALSPGFTTSTGFTIDGCIDKVVLSGHEACSRELGELVHWGDNNSLLAAQGLSDTHLSPGSGVTSAQDGATWALKLLEGNLTTLSQRSALISLMNAQNTRSGIPAGTHGVAVANRAGQTGAMRYDVGIVYHPRGTYILSVFSEGSSFTAIANLAAEVNTVMGQ